MSEFELKTYEIIDAYYSMMGSLTLLEDEIEIYVNYDIEEAAVIQILNESQDSLKKDILKGFSDIQNEALLIKNHRYNAWINLLKCSMNKKSALASLTNGDKLKQLKEEIYELMNEYAKKYATLNTLNTDVGKSCKKSIKETICTLKKMKNILSCISLKILIF